jgi:hypothetical protein
MGIKWEKVGISAGVGVIDEVIERQDRKYLTDAKRTAIEKENHAKPFRSYGDIARLALALGGLAVQQFGPNKYDYMGEAIALSATPLLVKSIAKAAMPLEASQKVMGEAFNFVPRRRVAYGVHAYESPDATPQMA